MFYYVPEMSEFSFPHSSGFRCTPLLVRVRRKTDLLAEVTDDGFMPDTIYIDQGTSIRWQWKQTSVPHTVSEVNYVFDKGCLSRQTAVQRLAFEGDGGFMYRVCMLCVCVCVCVFLCVCVCVCWFFA